MRPEPTIPEESFERILHDAIIRPAGRKFRGEPSRQVAILRLLRERVQPVAFEEIHGHLREQGVLRSAKDDPPARRKLVRQAVAAINDKLGMFFFRAQDIRLLNEMFRIGVVGDESDRPSAVLQDFFGMRKTSGVRFFATSAEPAGGLTRELYELVTELRPRQMEVHAASLSSFLGNPEFRALVTEAAQKAEGELRFLLLDPESEAVAKIERAVEPEVPLRGGVRSRIEQTLHYLAEIRSGLSPAEQRHLEVRLTPNAPLWRFRMIFLREVLHLRLIVPGAPTETLIKLDESSSLYRSLHDIFQQAWAEAAPWSPPE